jgi:alpha,alpha-trehalase
MLTKGNRIKLHVRKGRDDMYFESFKHWLHKLKNTSIRDLVGNHGGWECMWAKGIRVYDEQLDEEYQEGLSPGQEEMRDKLCQLEEGLSSDSEFTVYLSAEIFVQLAARMREQVSKYLWSPEQGLFFDYNCFLREQTVYESVTCFWTMWAGLATPEQALVMVPNALKLFEVTGGLVSGTEASRGRIGVDRPNRQWDYPYGWAPHQMLAWVGFERYGFQNEARRTAYRWLYTLTKSFVDFNGVVPEKFDIVNMTHKVDVEYGNVGADFKFVVKEGFGWMNASYTVFFFETRI